MQDQLNINRVIRELSVKTLDEYAHDHSWVELADTYTAVFERTPTSSMTKGDMVCQIYTQLMQRAPCTFTLQGYATDAEGQRVLAYTITGRAAVRSYLVGLHNLLLNHGYSITSVDTALVLKE